ncbi:MAG: efflux RND transporter periplasmic adaptor subunit [Chiayiivirga sp.]|jgi:HlyD family secretion protein|nr:efflux RND transporter periplasmic adaptor subunit [Chiayiivirga sp.]
MAKPTSLKNKLVPVVAATGIAILGWWAWDGLSDSGPGAGFVSGNGRIEATEVDVATKLPGRVEEILVREGDFVRSGQPLARMQPRNWTMTGRAYGAPRRPSRPARHRPPLPAPRSKPPGRSLSARSPACPPLRPVARIDADIADSELKAPRDGRVQVRVAHPARCLGAGGRVLNLLDLSDVYMTFFLPETVAGRVALGSEVRIVLDAAPSRDSGQRVLRGQHRRSSPPRRWKPPANGKS